MRLALVSALLVSLLGAATAAAQTIEAPVRLALTIRVTLPTQTGSRIGLFRLGTKDVVEAIKDDLGISLAGGMLVERREVGSDVSQSWLVVGRTALPLLDEPITVLDVPLPDSFFAIAEAVTIPPTGGPATSRTTLELTAISFGDLAVDGFESTLIGTASESVRLNPMLGEELLSNATLNVVGGALVDVEGFTGEAVVTGSFSFGPERMLP